MLANREKYRDERRLARTIPNVSTMGGMTWRLFSVKDN